ncbi:hypothetical protein ACWDT6_15065 [Nocardia grenadensis]|uniref:hypothetical protein n=1 Tax=Nocardia grenadensis TaxID=931537 RepID=UPI003D73F71F
MEDRVASLWRGLVNIIVYSVRSDDLGEATQDRITRALLTEPIDTFTPQQEFDALSEGLAENYPIPESIDTQHRPEEIRAFVAAVVRKMDAARPWPDLPYLPLPAEQLRDFFGSARPLARVRVPSTGVEVAVKRNFRNHPEFGEYLLLRLKSGVDVAFFPDFWDDSSDTLLSAAAGSKPSHEIVGELVAGSGLRAEDFTLTIWPEPPENGYAPYETTPLRPEFRGEHLPGNPQWGDRFVRYLSPAEREPYRLFANNGLLYTVEQQPLDTTHTRTLWTPQGGRAIFVMDEQGTLYASPYHLLGEFHHSSLLAGGAVAGAGEIGAVGGRVELVSDHSTHYVPARRFTRQVVDSLARQGLAVDRLQIEYHSPPDPMPG